MRRCSLPISCLLRILPLLLFASLSTKPASARDPRLSKYPLRIHVLASDATYRSPRMGPGDGVVCDSIDGVLTSLTSNGPGSITVGGPILVSGDPCSLHPEMVTGRLFNNDDDPVFSGDGRADLVSPPTTTQGLTFHYDNCSRVRVQAGFQSLPARWKKPGKKLEVLIPSDDIPVNNRPLPPDRCTFTVTLRDFIYLRLLNGEIVQVSQEAYWKKPAVRNFLSGSAQTIQPRQEQFTIPAHPTN
jgi:hypothetical protein